MSFAGRFPTAAQALNGILAGNATITLVSRVTGTRFTYKIQKAKGKGPGKGSALYFVRLLTGPDNVQSYRYLGTLVPRTRRWGTLYTVVPSKKAGALSATAPAFKALDWTLQRLSTGRLPGPVEVWHAGSCCRCGRPLTVPGSIASGLGPVCARKQE